MNRADNCTKLTILQVSLRRKMEDPSMPKTLITLICDNFKFSIDNFQYQNIWYIVNMFQLYKRQIEVNTCIFANWL
jgi:hypothetical protein